MLAEVVVVTTPAAKEIYQQNDNINIRDILVDYFAVILSD